ncbi:MAG: 2-oxoacid:acceptor oxidoreductase family protein [Nitrospirota bacterium]
MRQSKRYITVIFAGRGGQGVLTASLITAHAFFLSDYDVKKSDIKGIARRGGMVLSTVIAGEKVYSPKIVPETSDIAVVFSNDLGLNFSEHTTLVLPIDEEIIKYQKNLNIFSIGKLSTYLDISPETWEKAIRTKFGDDAYSINISAFYEGRKSARLFGVS